MLLPTALSEPGLAEAWAHSPELLVLAAIGSAVAFLAGLVAARVFSTAEAKTSPHAVQKRSNPFPAAPPRTHDFDAWSQKKLVEELTAENAELTNLFLLLPGLTKKINQTQRKRDVAPLLVTIVERLCIPPPPKILIFFTTQKRDELVVAAMKGYEEKFPTNLRVGIDEGRIGLAIDKEITLDQKDYEREDRIHASEEDKLPFKVEICAPIIHNRDVLGAVSVEGFLSYSKNAKKMLIVAANLGAGAIVTATMVQQIQHMADCDGLTQLYNKRYFFERMDEEIDKGRISGKALSIFMFDLDNFKHYNDTNGHQAGDEALKITGKLLLDRKRDTDVAARYGGEEFIVILPDTPHAGAYEFAESVRKIIESHPFPHGANQPLGKVSISGGVASYPEHGYTAQALIETADSCLYKAKQAGRNRIVKS